VTEQEIVEYVTSHLDGADVLVASKDNGAPEVAWGDLFFFYNPRFFFYNPRSDVSADRRFPFATIVTKDYPGFDTASNLDRAGVFRLNIGVSRETFQQLFPGFGVGAYDYTALDTPVPHPVYGRQHWVSLLNPGPNAWPVAEGLLQEAFQRAAASQTRRAARRERQD